MKVAVQLPNPKTILSLTAAAIAVVGSGCGTIGHSGPPQAPDTSYLNPTPALECKTHCMRSPIALVRSYRSAIESERIPPTSTNYFHSVSFSSDPKPEPQFKLVEKFEPYGVFSPSSVEVVFQGKPGAVPVFWEQGLNNMLYQAARELGESPQFKNVRFEVSLGGYPTDDTKRHLANFQLALEDRVNQGLSQTLCKTSNGGPVPRSVKIGYMQHTYMPGSSSNERVPVDAKPNRRLGLTSSF